MKFRGYKEHLLGYKEHLLCTIQKVQQMMVLNHCSPEINQGKREDASYPIVLPIEWFLLVVKFLQRKTGKKVNVKTEEHALHVIFGEAITRK